MEQFNNPANVTDVQINNLFEVEELEQRLENEWVIVIGDTEIPL